MLTKEHILTALRSFINQRPGLEFANYGEISAYRSELRQITKDRRDALELLNAVALREPITAADLLAAFPRAYSGRLSITEAADGRAVLDYCTGQYWPTEYRKAVCAVLSQCLWGWVREGCMPAPTYKLGDGVSFKSKREASEYAEMMHSTQNCVLGIEEKYDGVSAGDYIRRFFRREFGRSIASRWFN
jgi:hypothetical protein